MDRKERATLLAVALGGILAPLNSTMLAVALPAIVEDFGADIATAGWLMTGYLLALAVTRSALDVDPVIVQRPVKASLCGQPLPLDERVAMTSDARLLLRVHDIDAGDLVQQPLAIDLRGVPVQADL